MIKLWRWPDMTSCACARRCKWEKNNFVANCKRRKSAHNYINLLYKIIIIIIFQQRMYEWEMGGSTNKGGIWLTGLGTPLAGVGRLAKCSVTENINTVMILWKLEGIEDESGFVGALRQYSCECIYYAPAKCARMRKEYIKSFLYADVSSCCVCMYVLRLLHIECTHWTQQNGRKNVYCDPTTCKHT